MRILRSFGGRSAAGSVLIIVLWVAFGLVSLALYFGNSMSMELRAADNRVAALEAEQAVEGAARYAAYLLANAESSGTLPDLLTYEREEVPVGEAMFWFLGREYRAGSQSEPFFSLGDENGKLNVNTATAQMLENLPRMTPELAAAIVDWRDPDSEVTSGGAEDETYLRLRPGYRAKNGRFESVDELRLVFGMDLDILYGEDVNQNGILDPNENDGDQSWPPDNRDGRLEPGLAEYLTVYAPRANAGGTQAINITTALGRTQLVALLEETFGADRAQEIMQEVGAGPLGSVFEFRMRSGLSNEDFARIAGRITDASNPNTGTKVNVNTASAEVLACLPGIDLQKAEALVSYRISNANALDSVEWVAEVLGAETVAQAAPFLTASSTHFTADICAVGRHGRGFRRVRYVFEKASDAPVIVGRRDLTHLGWALGRNVMERKLREERIR